MLPLFPRLLKFRTASPLLSPYQDISESESDSESRERLRALQRAENSLQWRDVDTWDRGECLVTGVELRRVNNKVGSWGNSRVKRHNIMHIGVTWGWGVLSPGCGQLMTVCVIIVIKLHDTNLSLSHRVRHTTTSLHQTTDSRANLVTVYWKNIQNIKFRHIYHSLTISRWDRSNCKKSLILMHFLCFTQLRGAWWGPILYL